MRASRPPRVLVIDDERHVRQLLCELLAVWGCDADEATNGDEGLTLFRSGGYDLVLTDLAMPGVTGLEVIERVRRSDPEVGVIMLTGSAADVDAQGRRLRFTLLRKPLQLETLQSAVERALRERRGDDRPAPRRS